MPAGTGPHAGATGFFQPVDDAPILNVMPAGKGVQVLLAYSPKPQRYAYTWATSSAWRGTCRELVLELKDGTEHRALLRTGDLGAPQRRRRWEQLLDHFALGRSQELGALRGDSTSKLQVGEALA